MTAAARSRSARVDTLPLSANEAARSRVSAVRDESEGAAFAGRYRLQSCRGEGATSLVYQAVDLETGRRVAVKLLRVALARTQEARLRFQCEARMISRIVHPNVVSLVDFGCTSDDRPFVVMEYLEGTTLGELLRGNGSLSVERALCIGVQACRALQATHRAGIVHRDVKPDNLFVCAEQHGVERVKLLDFGIGKVCAPHDPLAQVIDALDSDRLVGTPQYMAPEQVCAPRTVNEQSDVYALGTVLCEAATGLGPHDGKSGAAIIDEILADPPAAAAAYRPALARGLGDIIAPARSYDRRDRFPSAQAFGVALSGALRALAAPSARAA